MKIIKREKCCDSTCYLIKNIVKYKEWRNSYILGLNATLGRRRIRKRRRKVKENMVRRLEIETFTRHVVETGNNILEKGL